MLSKHIVQVMTGYVSIQMTTLVFTNMPAYNSVVTVTKQNNLKQCKYWSDVVRNHKY